MAPEGAEGSRPRGMPSALNRGAVPFPGLMPVVQSRRRRHADLMLRERATSIPRYRQIYDWFRAAILDGQLLPGQIVPPTRSLALELHISRAPVLNAYEQLHAEGYLETRTGAGTRVATALPASPSRRAARAGPLMSRCMRRPRSWRVARRQEAGARMFPSCNTPAHSA